MPYASGRAIPWEQGTRTGLSRRRLNTKPLFLLLVMTSLVVANAADISGSPPVTIGPELGIASWYGYPYHGHQAADGEIYDMEELTAAHRTLPFGTQVRVLNLVNEKAVEVRINDRGPFVDGRIIDLSRAAARAIGLITPGITPVRVEVIGALAAVAAGVFAVQVGAFRESENAKRYAFRMESQYGSARIVERGDRGLWRVVVGREEIQNKALTLANRIRQETGEAAFVVRLDE